VRGVRRDGNSDAESCLFALVQHTTLKYVHLKCCASSARRRLQSWDTMLRRMSLILSLPVDVLGIHVFSFLSVGSLGRLDTAVFSEGTRAGLLEAFSLAAVDLPRHASYEVHTQNSDDRAKMWRWCIASKVTVKQMEFWSVDVDQSEVLVQVVRRVPHDGVVHYHCNLRTEEEASVARILNDDVIREGITSINITERTTTPINFNCKWGDMKKLTSLSASGTPFLERILLQVLSGVSLMKEIRLYGVPLVQESLVEATFNHALTLTHLTFHDSCCHPQLLYLVGRFCCNLQELRITFMLNTYWDFAWNAEAALIAVAKGCYNLQHVTFGEIPTVTDDVLLAFATCCPLLENLWLSECGAITGAVLLALATSCSALWCLKCDTWAVESVAVADAAQPMLGRPWYCALCGVAGTPPAVFARIVTHLRSCRRLILSGVSVRHLAALRNTNIPLTWFRDVSLEVPEGESLAADDLVLAVAASSTGLQYVDLGHSHITEVTLLILSEACPNLRTLVCKLAEVSSRAMLTLVRSWSHLQQLNVGQNAAFTDRILYAVAQHCPYLVVLDLFANTVVTETAVFAAVSKLPKCKIEIPRRFTADVYQRSKEAKNRVDRGKHG
jgi:hypothetical protein